jgi:hypothetical protein
MSSERQMRLLMRDLTGVSVCAQVSHVHHAGEIQFTAHLVPEAH